MASYLRGIVAPLKPALYYARVGWEVTKSVWTKEKLGPPSTADWPAAQRQLQQMLGNMKLSYLLNMSVKDAINKSLVGFQIFTFFIVGEIIGRRSIIGYKLKVQAPPAAGHH